MMDNTDAMPIAVRAYVPVDEPPRINFGHPRPKLGPSDYTLIFDTETTTDAAQQIRFGNYQIRSGLDLIERGIFYDPASLTDSEIQTLREFAGKYDLIVRTVAEFNDDVLFRYGYDCRAMIVGFNLPFDISRLAIGHGSARGKIMRGGFTFKLSANRYRPSLQVKHLSRRAAMIRFTVPGKQRTPRGQRRRKMTVQPHRGFFVDIKTVAAALTSRSFSLASLGEFLGVESGKLTAEEHGGPLTDAYLAYADRDVQTTWECFVELRKRYDAHMLSETPIYGIYSEAGLGKAYLKQMGILPWKDLQPDTPPELIGAIVSSYYGGRSEVHIRRDIRQVSYCDFLSMYPTVCILMGLWRFVIAQGMTWDDATSEAQALLDTVTVHDLKDSAFWSGIIILVEIAPQDDLFPVRARYGTETHYTIGLNRLTSDSRLWFTLADCIASKLLTGKAPKIIRAIRFSPSEVQPGIKPFPIAGKQDYQIDPGQEDFYRRLIDLRTETKQMMMSVSGAARDHLDAAQMAIKILANSTSYGIFFELNVEELADQQTSLCYARHEAGFPVEIAQSETPGRYFHPILATLITGAARLMLATAERLAIDAGLDWVFCDTDSLAIAKPANMADDVFFGTVDAVRGWFDPLNPYAKKGAILKLEDANYGVADGSAGHEIDPLHCLAISAKRYVLFNLDDLARPIIRKASGHGLGHLVAPYTDATAPADLPVPVANLDDIGVERWQHDIWYRIITATLDRHPNQVRIADLPGFSSPSVSRYGSTTPTLLRWFKTFSEDRPYREQVRPFGFMLAFQAKRLTDMPGATVTKESADDQNSGPGSRTAKKAQEAPRAVAPFDRDIVEAAKHCFDRDTGKQVAVGLLKTYQQSLLRYHLHPEAKFLGGEYVNAGVTRRRHIKADSIHLIGKEANRWEEQFHLGADPEAQTEYGMSPDERKRAIDIIHLATQTHGVRAIARAANMSRTLLSPLIDGLDLTLSNDAIVKAHKAIMKLDQNAVRRLDQQAALVAQLQECVAKKNVRQVARDIEVDSGHLSRILVRKRFPSKSLASRISRVLNAAPSGPNLPRRTE